MSNLTTIGLDIGADTLKACYATGEGAPKILKFAHQEAFVPSIAAFSGQSVVGVGQEVFSSLLNPAQDLNLKEDLRRGVAATDPDAEAGLLKLLNMFGQHLAKIFDASHLASDEFQTIVNTSAAENESQQAKIKRVVEQAGFPNVQLVNQDEAATFAFSAANKLKVYQNEANQLLVIDFAGQATRLTVLIWSPKEGRFKPLAQQTLAWGGRELDESLLPDWLFSRYLNQNPNSFSPAQRRVLLSVAQQLKEDLYQKLKHEQSVAKIDVRHLSPGLLNAELIQINASEFTAIESIRKSVQRLNKLLAQAAQTEPFSGVTQILLTGGTANLIFLPGMIGKIWANVPVQTIEQPEMAVAQGLVLMGSGRRIAASPKPQPVAAEQTVPAPPPPPQRPAPSAREIAQRRDQAARTIINKAIVIGVVLTIVVSVLIIPGIASFFLIALEFWLVQEISKVYNKRLTGGMQWFILVVLLAMSFGLKTVVETLLTIGLVTCLLKPVVSALVIWGIGELAIYVFGQDILSKYQS